ncbi:MAG: PBP1A family penicillin-binding protein [Pseudobdellovibrionaceae bacterium]|jgi:penicillin-binding protein 1A|nr:PBP1A family penicillin-binding protein [Pseudobdellovibrionaceae bacterium]
MGRHKNTKRKSIVVRPSRKSNGTSPSILRRLIKWGFVLGLWGVLILAAILAWFAKDLPDIIENPHFERKISITVLANDDSVIARYGDIKEGNVTADNLPKNVTNAILATEDRRFYYHFGLDPIGLARAIFVNMTNKGLHQGGSTITQQLAKNLFLSQEKTYKRKIQEALLAVWLEHELTKDEILAAYMNRVYLGAGTYGVKAAAKVYFNKDVQDLNLQEAAVIAGLLKAPSRYSPLSNPKAAQERAKTVLSVMLDAGYITKKQFETASAQTVKRAKEEKEDQAARYFSDWAVDNLEEIIGTPTTDIIVRTTMDPQVEASTAKVLKKSIEDNEAKSDVTQAASVVLRPDGSIVAIVGGVDYNESQFNRATQGLRQPGSSFKPFVYLAAIEKGASEETLIEDSPLTEGKYRPTNFGGKYYGEIRMIDALTLSLNTVAVKLAKAVGIENVIGVARRMGITADLEPNLSLALGSSEIPMIQMAGAYATIASGGYAIEPFGIKKIEEKETGKVLYEHKASSSPRVFRPRDIQVLVNMMISVVQNGTGQGAKAAFFAAGKTGTSQDHRDAWFDGFSQDYIAVVWFGNDDNTPMKRVTGGSLPARAWRDIIAGAKADSSPSKYNLIKDSSGSSGFADLLDSLMSTSFPDLVGENGGGDVQTAPHNPSKDPNYFKPDRPGDRVGYGRFND